MSTKNTEVPEVEHDELTEQALNLSARFPEVHHASDCIETVRLILGLFGKILKPDGSNQPATTDFDPRSLDLDLTYSLVDADKISKKLRALARSRGTKPVLTTWHLVQRLSPEISVLLEEGYTYPQLVDTLGDLGVEVSALSRPYASLTREPR